MREAARRELVLLQQGDPENRRLWEQFRKFSLEALDVIYQRLGVQFDYTLGESFYNEMLPAVVEDLEKRFIARESEGAIAIFSDGTLPPKEDPFLVSEGEGFRDNPLLVRKSDGGYNYATTDLATIRYRHDFFKAQRMIYVVGGPQQMHFRQLFAAASRWGYGSMKMEHVWFGTIFGPDKKPIKSREGTALKFRDLLAEAGGPGRENSRGKAQRPAGAAGREARRPDREAAGDRRAPARRACPGGGHRRAEIRRPFPESQSRLRL